MGIRIRNYQERDLELVSVLLQAAEAIDHAEAAVSPDEISMRFSRPGFEPEANVFVAEDDDGRIVGECSVFLALEAEANSFRSQLVVHPMHRGRGLEDRLLQQIERRARERLGEATTERVVLGAHANEVQADTLQALERAGLREVRRFWVMTRDELDKLPEAPPPPGVRFRTMQLGVDDEATRVAANEAFSTHYGNVDETPEEWHHFIYSPRYRPELTVLAEDTATGCLVGFSHIGVGEPECQRLGKRRGWIDILGVSPSARRQGLGAALLIQSMLNLRDAGMDHAALGCDAENTTGATRLYFRVGFKVHKVNILYSKELRAAIAA